MQELRQAGPLTFGILMMIAIEWWNRTECHGFAIHKTIPWQWIRRVVYMGVTMYILYFGKFDYNQFIYFQF